MDDRSEVVGRTFSERLEVLQAVRRPPGLPPDSGGDLGEELAVALSPPETQVARVLFLGAIGGASIVVALILLLVTTAPERPDPTGRDAICWPYPTYSECWGVSRSRGFATLPEELFADHNAVAHLVGAGLTRATDAEIRTALAACPPEHRDPDHWAGRLDDDSLFHVDWRAVDWPQVQVASAVLTAESAAYSTALQALEANELARARALLDRDGAAWRMRILWGAVLAGVALGLLATAGGMLRVVFLFPDRTLRASRHRYRATTGRRVEEGLLEDLTDEDLARLARPYPARAALEAALHDRRRAVLLGDPLEARTRSALEAVRTGHRDES